MSCTGRDPTVDSRWLAGRLHQAARALSTLLRSPALCVAWGAFRGRASKTVHIKIIFLAPASSRPVSRAIVLMETPAGLAGPLITASG